MTTTQKVVIVGAGQAGAELATALRQARYPGQIVLIGEEHHPPYRRPPLSKAFLAGECTVESLFIKPRTAYEKHAIECRTGVRVERIDRPTRTLHLSDGSAITYTKLALTTGGRPRTLPTSITGSTTVHYVRRVDDVERLRSVLACGSRLLIVGGGYIGLETAAMATKLGVSVTVLEAAPRVLARVASPTLSSFYEQAHRERGVQIRTATTVRRLEERDGCIEVVMDDGARIEVDAVVAGVGLAPNAEVAEEAGLEVADGIVVDERCNTSDPDIVAAGDCTQHYNGFLGRRTRIESVGNAVEQARVAAATICGHPARYDAVPWFWSDQYEFKLQMAGVRAEDDEVVLRGSTQGTDFSILYLRNGVLSAVDAINRPHEFMAAKRLIAARASVNAVRLTDESIPLTHAA